ncbi:arginyl-tRNA--protein transferase 1 [Trichoplusia ni]|uniref:Arginyl-tRNA--protein transferase 1 n=1 Tax=Trichoplusia ni TaxID=7111 RepID=A0A7E5VBU5_TRINI|nr:arginyl-tRNA--protein transferase 1 [Trichoplusia ni]
MLRSLVEYYAEHEQYRCGYCKRPDTNYSYGLWAHAMTVSDYQDLIDRGWRRSGKYCYKPTMDVTCCPMYTIRCRALQFKTSKSQKKVLKRVNKYLLGEELLQPATGAGARKMSTCSSGSDVLGEGFDEGGEQFIETLREHQDINIDVVKNSELLDNPSGEGVGDNASLINDMKKNQSETELKPEVKHVKKDLGPDPNKAPCKKAKQLRRERKLAKLKEKGIDVIPEPSKNKEKQIEDIINELPNDVKHKLEIKLVRTSPPSPEWLATAKETHEVYVKYQTTVHNDKPDKCTEPKFRDFLVQSPLLEEHRDNGPRSGYGSFHQQYWLDGKLIAVGVIDILPKCVSSVYFFYDPHYMNLTLGTYGALREIEFTRHLHSVCPQIEYYYMGFYIHSCRKMRYKGSFYPSDLLCPETYKWFPLLDCIPKLEASPYSRLDPDVDSVDENYPKESDLNYIPMWVNGAVMLYKAYKRHSAGKKNSNKANELEVYMRLVGGKTAKSLILVR